MEPNIFEPNKRIFSLWQNIRRSKAKSILPLMNMYSEGAMYHLAAHAIHNHVHEINSAPTPMEKGTIMVRRIAENMPVYIDPAELFATGTVVSRPFFDSIQKLDKHEEAFELYKQSRGNSHHIAVDYKKLITVGIGGIKNEITAQLELTTDHEKRLFYDCMLHTLDSVLLYANRFKEEAKRLASTEQNTSRQKELERIASALSNVPLHPATSLFEAMQAIIIYHVFLQINERGNTSLGRIDYILHNFYTKDLASKAITQQEASDYIAMMLINSSLLTYFSDSITIAGQAEEGELFYNDLTYFCFDAIKELKNENPQVGFRYMKGHPDSLFARAMAPIFAGVANPSIFGEEAAVAALIKAGFEPPDARNYVNCQCVELSAQGKSNIISGAYYKDLSLPLKILLGLVPQEDYVIKDYDCFDTLLEEYFNILSVKLEELIPEIFQYQEYEQKVPIMMILSSALIDGTIAKGKPVFYGGAKYNFTFPTFIASATAVDSLAAIKKAVFEDKFISLAKLTEICKNNFDGTQHIQKFLLNKCPKYGNNDKTTNTLMKKLTEFVYTELAKYQNLYDEYIGPCYFGFIQHSEDFNTNIATPDGRKVGDALSCTFGSDMGRDISGPTALFKSALSFDHAHATGGLAANFTIDKSLFEKEDDRGKLYDLLKTYLENGGMHVQFNFLDKNELLAAQQNPDAHFDLLVRVAGFTARFVWLNKSSQDQIIARIK